MILNKIDQCGGMGSTCYMSLNLFQTCLVLKSFFNNLSLHFRSTWLKKDKKIKTYAFWIMKKKRIELNNISWRTWQVYKLFQEK